MENYIFVRVLGTGKFGAVGLFRNKDSGEFDAIKFVKINPKNRAYVRNEIANMTHLKSDHIVAIKNVMFHKEYTCIVMEYCALGDLYYNIVKTDCGFPESLAKEYFWQLVLAVKACHDANIAHRDVKLENILLDASCRVKLCDLGLSNTADASSDIVGTPDYLAPEMVLEPLFDPKLTDVWACGITLYLMLYAKYPFSEDKQRGRTSLVDNIVKKDVAFPDDTGSYGVSADAKDLITKLLTKAPENRIGIQSILDHPWFASSDETRRNTPPCDMMLPTKRARTG
jgi:serine/threonine-protein kinase SRK2